MPEWIWQLVAVGSSGVGVYAAIRADLARLHENLRHVENTANEAHRRIDHFTERRAAR